MYFSGAFLLDLRTSLRPQKVKHLSAQSSGERSLRWNLPCTRLLFSQSSTYRCTGDEFECSSEKCGRALCRSHFTKSGTRLYPIESTRRVALHICTRNPYRLTVFSILLVNCSETRNDHGSVVILVTFAVCTERTLRKEALPAKVWKKDEIAYAFSFSSPHSLTFIIVSSLETIDQLSDSKGRGHSSGTCEVIHC